MARPQIHVLLDGPEVPSTIASALRRVDAGVRLSRLDSELRSPSTTTADARLVVTSNPRAGAAGRWEQLLDHLDRHPCATLVLTPTPPMTAAVHRGDHAAPLGFASNLSADELAGRLTAMCGFHQSFTRLRREIEELRQRDRLASASRFDEQLRLASQIQRDLLPHPLPKLNGAVLHALFRPVEHVSGDIYDVARLDEEHVFLSYADATGHGMPAALLTMLIKRTLQGKQVGRDDYRLVPPDEVLAQLSQELLEANLTQCLFVTGLYAVYHEVSRTLCWARGGAPYPILVRPGQPARLIKSDGPLLGVVENAAFQRVELGLEPGDAIFFHTDGLDALLLSRHGQRVYDDISETSWFQQLGSAPIAEQLDDVARRLDETPPTDWPADDLTMLALEIC